MVEKYLEMDELLMDTQKMDWEIEKELISEELPHSIVFEVFENLVSGKRIRSNLKEMMGNNSIEDILNGYEHFENVKIPKMAEKVKNLKEKHRNDPEGFKKAFMELTEESEEEGLNGQKRQLTEEEIKQKEAIKKAILELSDDAFPDPNEPQEMDPRKILDDAQDNVEINEILKEQFTKTREDGTTYIEPWIQKAIEEDEIEYVGYERILKKFGKEKIDSLNAIDRLSVRAGYIPPTLTTDYAGSEKTGQFIYDPDTDQYVLRSELRK